jgi:hypothetical protein
MIENYTEIPTAAPDTSRCATVTSGAIQPGDDLEENTITKSPRAKRSYTFRATPAERIAKRSSPRQFKTESGVVWMKRSGDWKKVSDEFLLTGFVVGLDGLTAALDVLLPDGGEVLMPADLMGDDVEPLSCWAAFHLLDLPDPRATGVWLREVIGTLRDVRRAPLRYTEEGERASRHLVRLIEQITGNAIHRLDQETATTA